ncbi:hypothetical protein BFJ70_g17599 [Fusarium oxysporum]|nr:hypothetical protein BFJ71_g17361 [Fusarium oxysporum]RKK97705.1 hypothetical protein BFJ70_g17599 [Fusarium oxysporum]
MISFALGITNGEDPDPHSQPPLTQYPEASSKTTSHRATAIFAIAMCTWKKTLCTGKGGTCQEELSRETAGGHVLLWMPQVGRWCGKGPTNNDELLHSYNFLACHPSTLPRPTQNMELQELPLERRVTDMLQNQNPTRVVVFLRKKSPFYSLSRDEVMVKACGSLGIDQVKSRAKLLTIWKCDRLTIFAFDLWYDDYDWATAHHKVDLPVLLVDYGKRSYVKVAGHEFQDEVNTFVARQHELHGWDAKPPYFQDQTGPEVPTYGNPRCVMVVGEDGTTRRAVKTPPPGSTSPYSS